MINPRVIKRHPVSLGGFGMSAIVILQGEGGDLAVQHCGCDPVACADMADAEATFERIVEYQEARRA